MDVDLINGIKQNDEKIFTLVYDLYHSKLYCYFLNKTASKDLNADLVQIVFIKCWRYRSSLLLDIPLSHQLFRIAKTSVIDLLRKKATERTVRLDDCPMVTCLPNQTESQHYQLENIRASLKLISPQRRKIVEWRLEGLSNTEIADKLSITKKTVENQLNKAVKEIRNHVFTASLSFPIYLLCLLYQS